MKTALTIIPIIFVLLLTSCKPDVVYSPYEAKIPISVSCNANAPKEPAWLTAEIRPDSNYLDKLKAIESDLNSYKGYTLELQSALKACS